MSDIPKSSGAYWWREKDGDEWCKVCKVGLIKGSHEVGLHAHFAGESLPVSVVELGGQWAKAHSPDEGIEAWAVFNIDEFFVSAPTKRLAQQAASQAMYGRPDYWNALEVLGGTCEPVTIYRKDTE